MALYLTLKLSVSLPLLDGLDVSAEVAAAAAAVVVLEEVEAKEADEEGLCVPPKILASNMFFISPLCKGRWLKSDGGRLLFPWLALRPPSLSPILPALLCWLPCCSLEFGLDSSLWRRIL